MVFMEKIARVVIAVTLGLLPLFFLPITRDAFEYNKLFLLVFSTLLLVALYAFKTLKMGRVELVASPLDKAVALFTGAYFLSYLVSSPNKIYALTQPGAAGTIFTLFLFYFASRQFLKDSVKTAHTIIEVPLLVSATIL